MNKSKRYNKSKRVKRFRKTKKGGMFSGFSGFVDFFKSKNKTKMVPQQISPSPSPIVTQPASPSLPPTSPLSQSNQNKKELIEKIKKELKIAYNSSNKSKLLNYEKSSVNNKFQSFLNNPHVTSSNSRAILNKLNIKEKMNAYKNAMK